MYSKEEILTFILNRHRILLDQVVPTDTIIELLSSDTYNLRTFLSNSTYNVLVKLLNTIFPGKINNTRWLTHILKLEGLKYCRYCNTVYSLSNFSKNASKSDGLNISCRMCQYSRNKDKQVARTAKYKAKRLNSCPSWADLPAISDFYSACPEGYHVDHIVPLQDDLVCGLHTLANLQYLTPFDNIQKNNRFIVVPST
jgi:hypothetical protein